MINTANIRISPVEKKYLDNFFTCPAKSTHKKKTGRVTGP